SQDEFENRKQKIDKTLASASGTRSDGVMLYYQPRREDMTATANYIAKNNPTIKRQLYRTQVNTAIIITLILAGFIYLLNRSIRFSDAVFVLVWFFVFYFLAGYIIRYNYTKQVSSTITNSTNKSLIARNVSISLNNDEITFSSDLGSSKLQWSAFQQID